MAVHRGPIEPGHRDRQVLIQQRALQAIDSAGAPIDGDWTDLTTEWMAREDVTGRERLTADQMAARYDTRWVMAYRADMDPEENDIPTTRRLVYRGRAYDIVAAGLVNRHEGVELMTLAGSKVAT